MGSWALPDLHLNRWGEPGPAPALASSLDPFAETPAYVVGPPLPVGPGSMTAAARTPRQEAGMTHTRTPHHHVPAVCRLMEWGAGSGSGARQARVQAVPSPWPLNAVASPAAPPALLKAGGLCTYPGGGAASPALISAHLPQGRGKAPTPDVSPCVSLTHLPTNPPAPIWGCFSSPKAHATPCGKQQEL